MFHSLDPMDGNLCPGKNTGMGSYSLLQRIFPTQETSLGIHTAGSIYHLSYQSLRAVLSAQSLSCVQLFENPWTAAHQAFLSRTIPWNMLNSCPLSWWFHPNISSSVFPFSSCLQYFLAPGSCLMSQLFVSCGQSIGASASVRPKNIHDWVPLGLTGLISLQSKGLSRVIPNTTVQKNQFFSAQLSLESSSHILTWLLEKP